MRRQLILCAVVLAACAKSEQPADTTAAMAPAPAPPPAPAPIALSDVAGTWDATVMPMERDTVLTTIEMTATPTMEGWKMKVGTATPAVKVVSVSGDSIVTEAGPFASVLRKGQRVSVHQVSRLRDGKLVGVVHARYANGDTATLRFTATKKAP